MTSSGDPLRDVGILLELFPYTEVARTNKSGHFSIIDRCENKSYTVKKNDYIPLRLEGGIRGANPLLIQLEDAGMYPGKTVLTSMYFSYFTFVHWLDK